MPCSHFRYSSTKPKLFSTDDTFITPQTNGTGPELVPHTKSLQLARGPRFKTEGRAAPDKIARFLNLALLLLS